MGNLAETKPHAVLVPFPAQGHINALFKFAKLLHLRGFHITFVNTEYNHKRLLKSRGPNSLDGFNGFNFETIPDGLTPLEGNGDVSQDLVSLCKSIRKNFLSPFCELLAKLQDSVTPPVTCIVSDCFMPFTIQAAEEHALPSIIFNPCNACTFLTSLHFRTLLEKGLIPLKDESYLTNGYLDKKVDCIPGLKNFRLKDLLTTLRTTDPNDSQVEFLIEAADSFHRASAIVFNTYNELESDVMKELYSMFPSLYTIVLWFFCVFGSSLWKEDTKCLEWLESKDARSVVYVNFGSITVMTPEKLLEFAWGLANSKKPFLWIIRPDLVIGGSSILSSEFENEISDRGLIVGWCSQEEPTNCRYICNEWEIGIEIDTNVKIEEVEKSINELMVGEKGNKMRQKAIELKKNAEENTSPGGCSYMNMDKVIKKVILKQC
ncbi:7-deoxyloganetin glucosyltransferase [Trifolium repens]|nr:7-deoxyloganetin glucosyltransferase [Trifolium repens]